MVARRPNRFWVSHPSPLEPRPTSHKMIASAQMYSWSPEIGALWRKLLEWVAARANVPLAIVDDDNKLTPLDELWSRQDLACAFMCGYPWALQVDPPHLLAAPVPSPVRYHGEAVYFSDFIVHADSDFTTLEDTFGSRIAYPPPIRTPGTTPHAFICSCTGHANGRRSTGKYSARSIVNGPSWTRWSTVAPT